MGQYTIKIPGAEPIQIKPVLTRVASSIGFDTYLIGNKFHPEKIFDFELYRSTWKKFYDTLIYRICCGKFQDAKIGFFFHIATF